MAEYKFDSSVDNNKIFWWIILILTGESILFYIPDIAKIDDRLKQLGAKPLRYYTKIVSG